MYAGADRSKQLDGSASVAQLERLLAAGGLMHRSNQHPLKIRANINQY